MAKFGDIESISEMSEEKDFISVMCARNMAEAEYYRVFLEDQDITVLIHDNNEQSQESCDSDDGVPILVPLDQLEEAELIIEQRSCVDEDFCDAYDDCEYSRQDDDGSDDLPVELNQETDDSDEEEIF